MQSQSSPFSQVMLEIQQACEGFPMIQCVLSPPYFICRGRTAHRYPTSGISKASPEKFV